MSAAEPARKAIIVAAGRGRRLGDHTDELPKCMVKVAGRPILHRQLAALDAAGVRDVVVVRGYRGERIDGGGWPLRFVENTAWATNNILASLLFAQDEMEGGFLFSYSDIVFAAHAVGRLAAQAAAASDALAALVIDRRWQDAYEGRTEHPVSEAELAAVTGAGAQAHVTRVGKRAVPAEAAAGEFIGLAYFTAAGARALRELWARLLDGGGLEQPFGNAATLRQAYLTDALNALVAAGGRLAPVFIDGAWREIDTRQDLERAEPVVDSWD